MASPLSLRVDVDMSELITAAQKSGAAVEDLGDDFTGAERDAATAASGIDRALSKVDGDARTAATGVDAVGEAAGGVEGAFGELGGAASSVLSGDVSGGVSSALASLGGMAAAVGIGGPVGSAVLGALGEAVGAWIAQLDLFGAHSKEVADEVANALVEVGGAFSAADLESRIQSVVTDTDKWAAAQTIAKATGMELGDVVAGLAGDADLAAESSRRLKDATDKAFEGTGPAAWISSLDLKKAADEINGVTAGLGQAPAKTAAYNAAMDSAVRKTDEVKRGAELLKGSLSGQWPSPTIKPVLDDSAIKNYRPPLIRIPAAFAIRPGQVQYTG